MIVVDTNIVAYLYLKGEHTLQSEKALIKDSEWLVPRLWRSEFRSTITQYLRKELVGFESALAIIKKAEQFMKGKEYTVSSNHVMRLVKHTSCSSYDCEFVALAEQFNTILLTVDKQILKDFSSIAIHLHDFIEQ